MLAAIPQNIPAFGTEIDPALVLEASNNTGRKVIQGDFATAPLPLRPTAIFGNPPFVAKSIARLLSRAAQLLDFGQRCGLILPAYFFQTSTSVQRLRDDWSISQEFIPRDVFNKPAQMVKPIVFAVFTRARESVLVGFRGYELTAAMRAIPKERQTLFDQPVTPDRTTWKVALFAVVVELGGQASLAAIYAAIRPRRPTDNPWWKEQIRKVAAAHLSRISEGVYALP